SNCARPYENLPSDTESLHGLDAATFEIYTLSLVDALPIYVCKHAVPFCTRWQTSRTKECPMHQRTTRALALGGLVALTLGLTACGPAIGGDDETTDSSKLQAPTEASPAGEITIWDREGEIGRASL